MVVLNSTPSDIPGEIEKTWMDFADGSPAAVRSSGSDEDGDAASAAGQYETLLNVEPGNLDDAVRRCIASAGDERVQTYEKEISGGSDSGRKPEFFSRSMSVVIQKMVEPSRAGVIFTADPITGDRSVMVVETVAGLGEALVSGHEEAARYVITAAKNTESGSSSTDSSLIIETSGDLENAAVSGELLENLRAGAALAAASWGMPLDLEWAVDSESGELYWLQARPITALADSLDSTVGPEELITRCNIGEMMPGAVTPLTLSTFGRSLSTGLAIYYRSFGAVRPGEPDPSFVVFFEDQLFMNLSSMYLMSRRVLGATREGTELGIIGYTLPPHDIGPMAPFPVRLLNGIRYFIKLFRWKSKAREIEELAMNHDLSTEGLNAAGILAVIRREHGRMMDRAVALHYAVSAFSGAMNAALAITLSGGTDISDESNRLITELLSGVEGVESAAVLEGLEELAGIIRGSSFESEIMKGDTRTVHEELMADESAIGDFYRSFMERHGHRCIREAELREPEWAIDPGHLIESLKALVQNSPRGKNNRNTVSPKMPELPEGVNTRAVKWIAGQARVGVRSREKSKSMLILVIHKFKLAARALSRQLVEEGLLPEADLSYFLTIEELEQLTSGRGEGLTGRARRRRRLYPQRMDLHFPDLSYGRPKPETPDLPEDGINLCGTPVSRGIAEGTVRVVKTRKDAEALQNGEIMVARFTDIGWTPFYARVAGMVTEIGGALSHGSVVAREYGMPLVGGLSGACTVLTDGMRVRIDGGSGTVTVLGGERESEAAAV
jgi:pyruvate,water dikinase